jgi:hypothetical protein
MKEEYLMMTLAAGSALMGVQVKQGWLNCHRGVSIIKEYSKRNDCKAE